MNATERQLLAARDARNAARIVLDSRTAQVKGDVEARSIGGRVADRLGEEARHALDQAIEVAGDSKLIVGAITGALTLWFLRHPIIAWFEQQIDELQDGEKGTDND